MKGVSTVDQRALGNGIGVQDGDRIGRWEGGIALYFNCVWMVGRTGPIGCDADSRIKTSIRGRRPRSEPCLARRLIYTN